MPQLSIIIAVYNDWGALDSCLRSIAQQSIAQQPASTEVEVIVVDDGSSATAPELVRRWADGMTLTIVKQDHAGISRHHLYPIVVDGVWDGCRAFSTGRQDQVLARQYA